MGLGILLIPALGGYLFVTRFNATRDRLHSESGYHVVFRSAVAGVVLFGIGRTLGVLADRFLPQDNLLRYADALWETAFPIEYSSTVLVSVLLGWLSPWLLNPFWPRLDSRRRAAEASGDHVGLVVDQAMQTGQLIEVSLNSGKSYVGAPLSRTFVARKDDGDLVVVPILSGYRDERRRELELTVNYAPVLRKQLLDPNVDFEPEDFRVAIPMREVLSARLFDREAFTAFREIRDRGAEHEHRG